MAKRGRKPYKKEYVKEQLEKAISWVVQKKKEGDYPQLSTFCVEHGLSIDFFSDHANKWEETKKLYKELHTLLAEAKLYSGLFAKRVKATHLITLDLMNNHGWREKKEEKQHQYIHDIDKIREKLKDEEE